MVEGRRRIPALPPHLLAWVWRRVCLRLLLLLPLLQLWEVVLAVVVATAAGVVAAAAVAVALRPRVLLTDHETAERLGMVWLEAATLAVLLTETTPTPATAATVTSVHLASAASVPKWTQ